MTASLGKYQLHQILAKCLLRIRRKQQKQYSIDLGNLLDTRKRNNQNKPLLVESMLQVERRH